MSHAAQWCCAVRCRVALTPSSLSGVAAYVGWQSSSILKPLLQQGLSDAEEFVIVKALNALTCMCQLGLLQKPHVYEFASDIGKLLVLRLSMGGLGTGLTSCDFILVRVRISTTENVQYLSFWVCVRPLVIIFSQLFPLT